MSVSLLWLFDGIAALPENDARVEDLTLDSREVRAGSLFVALRGRQSHGLAFAAEALARGASVVLWDPAEVTAGGGGAEAASLAANPAVFAAPIAGLRQLLGRLADRFFGWPSSHLRIVGITGTNGKTTSAYLLAQCLERLRGNAGYIGTIGWGRLNALQVPTHTTPDVVSVHRQLAKLRAAGVRDVAMEVSSHALDQGRVDGVRFHSATFTNLTRDHLDYHASMEAYGAAKARLFAFPGLRHLVVNIGDAYGRDFASRYNGRVPLTAVWVGAGDSKWLADRSLYVDDMVLDLGGICMTLGGTFGRQRVTTQLLGRFNAENSVVVLACLLGLDVPLDEAAAALAGCKAPPGRMELIGSTDSGKPVAVVDYAHTPDALAKALTTLREHCRGALWCVFGCGGDRDTGKRPLMGAIADELADEIIVTDDNPRSESPQSITKAILDGIKSHIPRIIHDRAEAIATALEAAMAEDMVLIAGKGHEDYQIYGDTRRSFSDRVEALRFLGGGGMRRDLQDAAQVLGGQFSGANAGYAEVSTDSRTLNAGSLFVALRGPNFDGTEFVAAAAARGAVGALVERAMPLALPQIVVPDTLAALQRLGRTWRDEFDLPVVGVAGSNGKTTAKEMIAAILSRMGSCLATRGNLNNHIGVPLTLLRLESAHRSAVIEVGANRVGEVAELVKLVQPTVGLITNAGAEHLEFFGDLDGVAKGEGEMVAGLEQRATAIINADDAYADYWRSVASTQRIVTFGVHAAADFSARDVVQTIETGEFATRFTLLCQLGECEIRLRAGGAHNVINALAAAAAAGAAGATLEEIALGLRDFRAVSGRLQLKAGIRGSWIIDDSYNANPSSVRAGIDVLRALSGPTWLVFADMGELGEHAADSHAAMGRYAREGGIKRVFATGPQSVRAVEAFGGGATWFPDVDSLTRALQAELAAGVTVLVKGSRVNRLERVVRAVTVGAG